jgi:hypothetical protein
LNVTLYGLMLGGLEPSLSGMEWSHSLCGGKVMDS